MSPLFYGLLSNRVSNAMGLAVLSGVRVRKNLPGAWTLQCGVDGVMMDTPVRGPPSHVFSPSSLLKQVVLNDVFPSQPSRPSVLSVISYPFNCSAILNNPASPCPWSLYTRRPVELSLASASVQVGNLNYCFRLRCYVMLCAVMINTNRF